MSGLGAGGGLKAIADMSAKNVIFFGRLPHKIDRDLGIPLTKTLDVPLKNIVMLISSHGEIPKRQV